MISEAIILAGGFGTRLQTVVADKPKPMALVNDKPFLHYIFDYLKHYQIKKVILSVGYKAEIIQDYFKFRYNGIQIDYAYEKEPLGTGGGIRLAMEKCKEKEIFVLNGDSFFDLDLNAFYHFHNNHHADVTLAVRSIENTARYGTIELNGDHCIRSFKEKDGQPKPGFISAGIYVLDHDLYIQHTPAHKNFSIEKNFFEPHVEKFNLYGYVAKGYFIDIGIPEDYARAQREFKEFTY